MCKLPLSIREVKPFPCATLIHATRFDGLPEGVHTGGAYSYEGKIYKPLDGRPFVNADYHYPTQEDVMLEKLHDLPSFPKNWEVQELNGRRWLVRDRAFVAGQEGSAESVKPDKEHLLQIEKDIMIANGRGWQVGDKITIANDESTWQWFVLDLSCAHWMKNAWGSMDNESDRVSELFTRFGYEQLAAQRQSGRHVLSEVWMNKEFKFHEEQTGLNWGAICNIYGSFYRPISKGWATLPKECFTLQNDKLDHEKQIPLTYLFTAEPLTDKTVYDYELTLLWQRWTECSEGCKKYKPEGEE